MELPEHCCRSSVCMTMDYSQLVHRPSGCEQCSRTRSNSRNSDCDSDLVEKCRPYKSSAARSRYVNVCAAVCLLLLVGGLSPQSSAAPHRSRGMERPRRSADSSQENRLWANPCDYNNSNSKSALKYSPKLAKDVASQARNALKSTAQYKDKFALKLHSYPSFDELLQAWTGYDWLRKFPWFREEVLPKEKVLNQLMPDEYMNQLMDHIDEILPSMYKGLKMVVAGLYAISNEGLNDNIISDESLKGSINLTMHDVRAVLCLFNDIMKSRNLEIMPLPDSEIPNFKTEDKLSVGLLVYRDTLNYLEYLSQVFQKMYETAPKQAD
ncbi:unnamed protein product [Parnassius apollo]|uniref:(apollo) hypothetical protein n=1 Tax=Parnassius apollo TaxID=110799 RepID=A0A8S3WQP0_PARAO|nr:unnamed protein product [Parnassius apollo]